ncbi:MAG TPA: low molecular weight protein tyrosine phosphatase family protein [Burkholderiaceae bacterium]|nr:low molecular weight protein tyrosine phosphatase family protein [Burkholderiaceae bacterium]
MKRVLFVCSQNLLRSPTAEQVFAGYPGIECMSAGTNHDAENPITPELIQWADVIFVMEPSHRSKLKARFGKYLANRRLICLDIPDDYSFMDAELVRILKAKVPRLLPTTG